jgi:glycosyltransferase involved in cell wall biosynthesis
MIKPRIVFFTKYSKKGPSSRYRTFNYLPFFEPYYELEVMPLFDDHYINTLYSDSKVKNPIYHFKRFFKRVVQVLGISKKNTLVVIEYELFPYFPPIFEIILKWRGIKFILDFDDAIFHNYDSSSNKIISFFFRNKIARIARIADHIITGSPYLTEYFLNYSNAVTEIPTSIEFKKYNNHTKLNIPNNYFRIGWLGSNSTSLNLISLIPAFQYIFTKYPFVIFSFCGIGDITVSKFDKFNFEVDAWSQEKELEFLRKIQVGIMPLEINKFNQGKCGFKLIQYMAMERPTISTPLAANVKIDHQNGNLFARDGSEWIAAFDKVINEYERLEAVGLKNKKTVQLDYSIESNYKKYLRIYQNINF